MENKYEKWAMESLDEITDKLQTGVLFDGENEKLGLSSKVCKFSFTPLYAV